MIEAAVKVLPPSGADRAIAVPSEGGYFVAVADGAGGTGGGASAADRLIVALTKLRAQAAWADWWSVLLELDTGGSEMTATKRPFVAWSRLTLMFRNPLRQICHQINS